MPITKKDKLVVKTTCDLCGESMGTSLIDPDEYRDWLKHTTDLLTFNVDGKPVLLCWVCIRNHDYEKLYNRRLNDLTYPKDKAKP